MPKQQIKVLEKYSGEMWGYADFVLLSSGYTKKSRNLFYKELGLGFQIIIEPTEERYKASLTKNRGKEKKVLLEEFLSDLEHSETIEDRFRVFIETTENGFISKNYTHSNISDFVSYGKQTKLLVSLKNEINDLQSKVNEGEYAQVSLSHKIGVVSDQKNKLEEELSSVKVEYSKIKNQYSLIPTNLKRFKRYVGIYFISGILIGIFTTLYFVY